MLKTRTSISAALPLALALGAWAAPAFGEEPAAAPKKAPVIAAIVNGVPITEYDITPPNIEKVVHGEDKEAQIEQVKRLTLYRKVVFEVLYQEAASSGVSVPQNALQRYVNSQVLDAGGLLTFVRKLRQRRMSYAEWVQDLKRELTVHFFLSQFSRSHSKASFLDQAAQDLAVAPEEITQYYEDNPKDFLREKKGKARAIVVYGQDFPSMAEAEAHARKIHAMAAEGQDFAELAKKYSGVRSAQGGLFDLSGDSGLKAELASRMDGFKEGQVTEVFRLGTTFNILKLEERKEMIPIPLAEAQEAIKDKMRRKALEKEQKLLMARLLEKASILPASIVEEIRKQ